MTSTMLPGQEKRQDVPSSGDPSISVDYEMKQVFEDSKEQEDNPIDDEEILERWNTPKINLGRFLAALYSFIVMGMNDAAYGVSPIQIM
jgi:hypothetical protein